MEITPLIWAITIGITIVVFSVDLFIISRRPHEPSMKEAGAWSIFYIGLAVLFGIGVLITRGPQYGGEFFAGFVTEKSLSMDNLFVFILIMASLKVPRHLQQFALMIGIVLALIFRGVFIAVGAVAIDRFAAVFYLFGAILIYTAVKMVMDHNKQDSADAAENRIVRFARRRLPFVDSYHGTKLMVRVDGRLVFTSMALVIIALGSADILFALDSIPAIYGITQEPYLVFTANAFALMGLRQLYFLIGGLLQRLVYLSYGLAIILAFIGVKLFLHAMHESAQYADAPFIGPAMQAAYDFVITLPNEGEIPIWLSLTVILGVLVITTVASLIKNQLDSRRASSVGVDDQAAESKQVSGSDSVDSASSTVSAESDPAAGGNDSESESSPAPRGRSDSS